MILIDHYYSSQYKYERLKLYLYGGTEAVGIPRLNFK